MPQWLPQWLAFYQTKIFGPQAYAVNYYAKALEIRRRNRWQVFSRWRQEFLERADEIFPTRSSRGDEQERIAELERMVGRLTIELETAKKASHILTSLPNGRGR